MSTLINHDTKSQCAQILKHLQDGKTLTAIESLSMFGCFRLPARIDNLRQEGYKIETEMIRLENGKRIGRYSMEVVK